MFIMTDHFRFSRAKRGENLGRFWFFFSRRLLFSMLTVLEICFPSVLRLALGEHVTDFLGHYISLPFFNLHSPNAFGADLLYLGHHLSCVPSFIPFVQRCLQPEQCLGIACFILFLSLCVGRIAVTASSWEEAVFGYCLVLFTASHIFLLSYRLRSAYCSLINLLAKPSSLTLYKPLMSCASATVMLKSRVTV